jgi:FHS family L-fucose permease-like MFS transporter
MTPSVTRGFRLDPGFVAVTGLFFAWGFVTSTIDPLIPSVRSVFDLSYAQSMLTQFAFFMAYAVFSLPGAGVLAGLGFPRTIMLALAAMILGCLLMPLATHAGAYWIVLGALFVIAAGVTQLQVAANPLAAALGSPGRAHFRLTLAQAVNSLGHVLGPFAASFIMLRGGVFAGHGGDAARRETLRNIDSQFLLVAAILALLMLLLWAFRRRMDAEKTAAANKGASPLAAFRSPWAAFGAAAIFLYVGSEVAIGSILISYLQQKDILGVPADQAGRLLSIYWGAALVGRATGSLLLIRVPAARLLALYAAVAAGLCLVVVGLRGDVAAWSAIAIGLFNSIMFPTIFSLTLERSSAAVSSTSGLLCMAIVGGAVLPPVMGLAADGLGVSRAFVVPLIGYVCVLAFALLRPRSSPRPVPEALVSDPA